ncbi:MAG: hypothetical protein HYV68_03665 [Candidatus Taylorbacteria bacterium]|nr:hypothetical protein [Candidatus Taylorbacteria bacterium]
MKPGKRKGKMNPMFTSQGIPVRFPQAWEGLQEERSLITDEVSKLFENKGGIASVSHVFASISEPKNEELVTLHLYRFGSPRECEQILGSFKFSDRKVRPLYLTQV